MEPSFYEDQLRSSKHIIKLNVRIQGVTLKDLSKKNKTGDIRARKVYVNRKYI